MPDNYLDFTDLLNQPYKINREPEKMISDQFSTTATEEQLRAALADYCRMTERDEREAHGLWVTDPAEKQSRARLSEQMRGEMQGLLRLYRDIRSVGGQDSPYEADDPPVCA